MKYKHIGFFEYHVEKFVLAIGLILALVILWKFVLDDPYHATMRFGPTEQTLAPKEVEEKIAEQADKLQGMIGSDDPNIEQIEVPDYTQEFRKRLVDALILPRRLPTTLAEPGIDPRFLQGDATPTRDQLALPDPPKPYDPVIRKSFAVLDEQEADQGLVQLVAERRGDNPLDINYVSVKMTFDMTEWRMKLRRGPVPRIPEEWWRSRLAITGVKLERQTLDPRTGTWGPIEQVPLLPGQVSFHGLSRQFTQPESTEALREVIEMQDKVRRPDFVPIAAGEEWLPPGSVIERLTPAQRQRKEELEARINEIRSELGLPGADPMDRPGVPGAGMNDPAAPFIRPEAERAAGRAAGVNQRLQSARNVAANRQAVRLKRELEELQNELDNLVAEEDETTEIAQPNTAGQRPGEINFDQLGRNVGGLPPQMGDPQQDQPQDQPQRDGNNGAMPADPIDIWAHDLTVEPGKTYRYRMNVAVVNPLFYRGSRLNEEQAEANQMKLSHMGGEDSASDWTEPVSIAPERLYFVVDADNSGNNATFEVWRIFNGEWRFRNFTASPGDKIGGTVSILAGDRSRNVDMSVDAVLVDLTFSRVTGPFNSSTQSTEALLMSEETGRLFTRSVLRDDTNEQRQMLLQQVRRDELATAR